MGSKPTARALAALAGASTLLASLLTAPAASAFCRTTTVGVPADFNPRAGQCWDQGIPLWWKNACVGYSLQKDGSRQVSFDDASNNITRAFTKWTGTSCPTEGDTTSRVSIDVRDLGPVNCGNVQYNSSGGNQHVIVFRDTNWPHNDSSNTLALTTVTFNPDTGEIYDADMEINTAQQRVTAEETVPADGYDFLSIITHEAGHFLGLAHSGDQRATMFAHYSPGSTVMRNLAADDVSGVCTVYRPDGSRAVDTSVSGTGAVEGGSCDPTPRKGFSTECKEETPKEKTTTGCLSRVAPGVGQDDGAASLLPFAGLVAAAALRRRRSRTSSSAG